MGPLSPVGQSHVPYTCWAEAHVGWGHCSRRDTRPRAGSGVPLALAAFAHRCHLPVASLQVTCLCFPLSKPQPCSSLRPFCSLGGS